MPLSLLRTPSVSLYNDLRRPATNSKAAQLIQDRSTRRRQRAEAARLRGAARCRRQRRGPAGRLFHHGQRAAAPLPAFARPAFAGFRARGGFGVDHGNRHVLFLLLVQAGSGSAEPLSMGLHLQDFPSPSRSFAQRGFWGFSGEIFLGMLKVDPDSETTSFDCDRWLPSFTKLPRYPGGDLL